MSLRNTCLIKAQKEYILSQTIAAGVDDYSAVPRGGHGMGISVHEISGNVTWKLHDQSRWGAIQKAIPSMFTLSKRRPLGPFANLSMASATTQLQSKPGVHHWREFLNALETITLTWSYRDNEVTFLQDYGVAAQEWCQNHAP